jgi:hypothetical protein
MIPPFISYITFNRLGLTIRSLSALLNSTEDFELHLIDSNSGDDTWEYIMSLSDSRIRTKERFEVNHGKIYALNLHLLTRRPEQYFFTVDSGVCLETAGWIGSFLRVFKAFPEAGLLGVSADDGYLPKVIPRSAGGVNFQELVSAPSDAQTCYIPGYCMGLRPELIKEIGYFCEENYYGEKELSYRVCNHTGFKAGFVPDVNVRLPETVSCGECAYSGRCTLDKVSDTCFKKYDKYDKNEAFRQENRWRFEETVRDMKSGARPVFCASILDAASTKKQVYNRDWAMANIVYFIRNAN